MTDAGRGGMDMGDIVAGAWNSYRRAPASWLAITFAAIVLVFVLQWAAEARFGLSETDEDAPSENTGPISAILAGTLIVDLFTHVALVAAAAGQLSGAGVRVRAAYLTGLRRFPAVLFASLATALVAALLGLTIVLLPLAIYFLVTWSLATQVIVIEKELPFRALARSRQIVRGGWWRTLGINLAIVLLAFLPGFVIGRVTAPFDAPWITAAGVSLGGAVAAPFVAIAQTLLYADLRARKGERPFLTPLRETP